VKVTEHIIPSFGGGVTADYYDTGSETYMFFLMGSHTSRENQKDLIDALASQAKLNVLVPSYSGFEGDSKDYKNYSPAMHFIEVIEAYDWMLAKFGIGPSFVLGGSYGGYLAVQLLNYRHFDNLILRAPAILPPKDFYTTWEKLDEDEDKSNYRRDKEALAKHPLLSRVEQYTGNTLVIVHGDDQSYIVSFCNWLRRIFNFHGRFVYIRHFRTFLVHKSMTSYPVILALYFGFSSSFLNSRTFLFKNRWSPSCL